MHVNTPTAASDTQEETIDCEMHEDQGDEVQFRYRRPWWGVKKYPENESYSLDDIDLFIDRDEAKIEGKFELNSERSEPYKVTYLIRNQTIEEESYFSTGAASVTKYYMFRSYYLDLLNKKMSFASYCRAIVKFTLYSTYSKLKSAVSLLQKNLNVMTPCTNYVLFEHDFTGHAGRFPNEYYSSNVNYSVVMKSL